jgi:hypothetical protein
MTLRRRLAKLEARREVTHTGPRIIIHEIVWRDDEGLLKSVAQIANVLTADGWQIVSRGDNESEPAFHTRVEAMSSSAYP